MSETPKFYISNVGNYWRAHRPDGWLFAQITVAGNVLNGSHDGTDEGREAYDALVKAIEAARPEGR